MKKFTLALAGIAVLALASCANTEKPQSLTYHAGNEQVLYNTALQSIATKDFKKASDVLTQLNLQFPFGALKYETDVLDTYNAYIQEDYASAISRATTLLNSNNKDFLAKYGDYVLLVKGISLAESNRGFFQKLFNLNIKDNDLTNIQYAIGDFDALVKNFPQSQYKEYATQLRDYYVDIVAEHNLDVAKFYMKHTNPVAAYKQASIVVATFPNTVWAMPALEVQQQAAKQLGLDLSEDAQAIKDKLAAEQVRPRVTKLPAPIDMRPSMLVTYVQENSPAKK